MPCRSCIRHPAFKQRIIELIAQAERRIYLVALYLRDDEAGREIMPGAVCRQTSKATAGYQSLCCFHRAQRGLISKGPQSGNRHVSEFATRYPTCDIAFYGVPVSVGNGSESYT